MFALTHHERLQFRLLSVLPILALMALAIPATAQTPAPRATAASSPVKAVTHGNSERAFLGVNVREVKADLAGKLNLPETRGAEITGVVEGTAADKAGLRKGDVVLEYNEQRVEGVDQFTRLVSETPVGREIKVKVFREGAEKILTGTMGSRKASSIIMFKDGSQKVFEFPDFDMPDIRIPDIPQISTNWKSPKIGIIAESLSGQFADYFGVKEGVLVRAVDEDSPAARAGLKAGDVILKVGDVSVTSPREITTAIRELDQTSFPIQIMRNRNPITIQVTLPESKKETGFLPFAHYIKNMTRL